MVIVEGNSGREVFGLGRDGRSRRLRAQGDGALRGRQEAGVARVVVVVMGTGIVFVLCSGGDCW